MVRTPERVCLIKSKYVYKLKKDWLGKVIKRKSRFVVQGFLQQEGVDYGTSGEGGDISIDAGSDEGKEAAPAPT